MTVRAKFRVSTISKTTQPDGVETSTVSLSAVCSGSEENEKFFKYTPGGSISLSTINPEAASQFEEGKEYYVDFTFAQEAAPAE